MPEVRLADLLGLEPGHGRLEVAQEDGRGDVVQEPRFRREGGGGRHALEERERERDMCMGAVMGDIFISNSGFMRHDE